MHLVWVRWNSGHAGKDLADHLAVSAGMADGKTDGGRVIFSLSNWGTINILNYVVLLFALESRVAVRANGYLTALPPLGFWLRS